MGVDWGKIRAVFEQALDYAPEGRAGFLDAACGEDAGVRREVEALLAAHERPGAFLTGHAADGDLAPERRRQINHVREAALARDGEERAVFLDMACAGDAPLRALVEALLAEEPTAVAEVGPAGVARGASPAAGPLGVGTVVEGKYRVEGVLGEGGMGAVYRATHLQLERPVALKVIRGELLADPAAAERFRREAVAVARLRHPSIVMVYDYGVAEGVGAYLVMEVLEGHALRQALGGPTRLEIGEALGLMGQVCAGVAAAHRAGVIHRDLKPENIFLEQREGAVAVKVLDFGLAKLEEAVLSGGGRLTVTGAVQGTPAYMSPEQCRGEEADARSDVYALGCVLYEMLTGRPPFLGSGMAALIYKHINEAPRPPSELVGEVAPGLEEAVLRALAKAPEERHQTVEGFGQALGVLSGSVEATTVAPGRTTAERGVVTAAVTGAGEGRGPAPNNLPQAVTRFVGREPQIVDVQAWLGKTRLVTMVGVGGIGKTRLALEVAGRVLGEYEGGVWVVELAALTDPALVVQAVASALGVGEESGRPMEEALTAWLEGKRVLLVLDNCEHVVEACAHLTQKLLEACLGLHVLATSREALGVAGEAAWSVPALTVQVPGEVLASEAERLFVDRAVLARPGFEAAGPMAPAVAAVCRRLEGIPLAIELAAARVKVLSVEQILARLDDRFRLLSGGGRTAPSRQQTLRATLDWSYDLLTEQERAVLRRLSVFAGGWTLDAAEGVCGEEGGGDLNLLPPSSSLLPRSEVLDLLAQLVEKSLVFVEEHEGRARYRMLETVRDYAWENLRGAGEERLIAERHRDWFLRFAQHGRDELINGPEQRAWLARLEVEHDNLRAALVRSLEHDADGCLRLAVALRQLWAIHGHYTEGRRWLEAALERTCNAPVGLRAEALRAAGNLARQQGDLSAARASYEESLQIERQRGDMLQIAASSYGLGIVAQMQGDFRAARSDFEESLATAREVGRDLLIACSLTGLGELARLEGDLTAARAFYEQSIVVYRRAGHEHSISVALCNLGAVACEEGDLAAARACYQEALAIDQAFGNKDGIAFSLDGLGAVAVKRGAWARAARLAGAAQALRDVTGYELDPADRGARERCLAQVREQLGEAGLEAALAAGRALKLEQATEYALTS